MLPRPRLKPTPPRRLLSRANSETAEARSKTFHSRLPGVKLLEWRALKDYFRMDTCSREFLNMDRFVYSRLVRLLYRGGGQRATRRGIWDRRTALGWLCTVCVGPCATQRKPHQEDHR